MFARPISKLKINRLPVYEEVSEKPLSGTELLILLQNVLDMGASFRFRAKGFSKSPFVTDGDVIDISPLQGTSPHIGNIITFIHPKNQKLSIHRIVGKNNGSYLITGDNGPGTDGWVPRENILGYLSKVKRKGRDNPWALGARRMLIALLTRASLLLPVWKLVRKR
jgi:signal peptidase I